MNAWRLVTNRAGGGRLEALEGLRFTKRAVRADLHGFKAYAEMNEG